MSQQPKMIVVADINNCQDIEKLRKIALILADNFFEVIDEFNKYLEKSE